MSFDFNRLTPEHRAIAHRYLGAELRQPDVSICGEQGQEYLFRWHVLPRNPDANVYFHIQVASDPERPLHDHPWDNQSVILAGGYDELVAAGPLIGTRVVRQGDVIARKAAEAHRLILPAEFDYTITQFTTGPRVREWGFWINDKWYSHDDCAILDPVTGISRFVYPEGTHP